MIAAPLFPDLPAEPAHGCQDGIAGFGTRPPVFPWLGVFAGRDNRLRLALHNRFMTAFGVLGTINADASNGSVGGILAEQAPQYRRIASTIVSHFDRRYFQRRRVNPKVHLAPLSPEVGPMFLVSH